MNGISSELLKYRRTFMGKLIVLIPLFFTVYALVIQLIMNDSSQAEAAGNMSMSWTMLLALVFNWWSFLFLPLGMALFAGMVASQEKRAGNYRGLRAHHISPVMLWVQKVTGMAVYFLISALVLITVVTVTGLCMATGTFPFGRILAGSLLCWFTALTLIPIQLWIATWGGMTVSLGVGFVGMLGGVLAAPTPWWIAVPWSWAARLMCPVIGVHPNNTLLEPGSPLLHASVIPAGLSVSVLSLIAVTGITGVWFSRREA